MWAESRWVESGAGWLEARSTAAGVTGPLRAAPPPSAVRHEAVFSVVIGSPGAGVRRLPMLYLGNLPIFADRDVEVVTTRLERAIAAVLESTERAVYSLHACRLGARVGLYGREKFSRSAYRSKLRRHGVLFADDPFVTLTERGTFRCEGWGELEPSFLIMGSGGSGPSRAFTAFAVLAHRLGRPAPPEVQLLARTLRPLEVRTEDDPAEVVEALRA